MTLKYYFLAKFSGAYFQNGGPFMIKFATYPARTKYLCREIASMLPFDELCDREKYDFPVLSESRDKSLQQVAKLKSVLAGAGITLSEELSLVLFGSIARLEWTSGSDADWTLLVDGPVNPDHFRVAQQIRRAFKEAGVPQPGPSGLFGSLTSSHDLVHHIGGNGDSNPNLTRRLLLLLESVAITGNGVRERVIRAILNRYILWGRGIPSNHTKAFRVPRFLLNDIFRFWRTLAVDYAAKKWERDDAGWALRNAKLRISRKLLFAKGILLCFDCELFPDLPPWQELTQVGFSTDDEELVAIQQVNGTMNVVNLSPVDVIARLFLRQSEIAKSILFEKYNAFLSILEDGDDRQTLQELAVDEIEKCDVFDRVRTEIGECFGDELAKLFFDDSEPLAKLTRKYGVF